MGARDERRRKNGPMCHGLSCLECEVVAQALNLRLL